MGFNYKKQGECADKEYGQVIRLPDDGQLFSYRYWNYRVKAVWVKGYLMFICDQMTCRCTKSKIGNVRGKIRQNWLTHTENLTNRSLLIHDCMHWLWLKATTFKCIHLISRKRRGPFMYSTSVMNSWYGGAVSRNI